MAEDSIFEIESDLGGGGLLVTLHAFGIERMTLTSAKSLLLLVVADEKEGSSIASMALGSCML